MVQRNAGIFFKLFFLVILGAMFLGLAVLPVVLSVLGPRPVATVEEIEADIAERAAGVFSATGGAKGQTKEGEEDPSADDASLGYASPGEVELQSARV